MPATVRLELEGMQYSLLSDAIQARFPPQEFARMLKMRLNKTIYTFTSAINNYPQQVFDVIDYANSKGWVFRLVNALREEVPNEPVFVEYAQMLRVTPQGIPDRSGLESIINASNATLDIAVFLSRLGKIESQVCRVDIQGSGVGTGFLVGPKMVMTNYHVVEKVVDRSFPVSALTCKFDYKVLPDGSVNQGVPFKVSGLAAASPYDPADFKDDNSAPDPDNLDYALLEVEGDPGNKPIGGKEKGLPRRWIAMPEESRVFVPNEALFIVQHPNRQPMQLALEPKSVIGPYGDALRVRHRTNTEHGSSGSPCFDAEWNLIALHHSGDPSWLPKWNEAIPMHLIRGHAKAQGIPLGDDPPPSNDEFPF